VSLCQLLTEASEDMSYWRYTNRIIIIIITIDINTQTTDKDG